MLVIIKGAGDLASGIAYRLNKSNFEVIMTDIANPTSIRNTVSFNQAIIDKETTIDGVKAVLAKSNIDALEISKAGNIAVLVDESAECVKELRPYVLVDAILAKKNLGTTIDDATIVIGVGPGFNATVDCNAVVETLRGHNLGRVIYNGEAAKNTNVPGLIGGFSGERIIRATDDGIFHPIKGIGDFVTEGDVVAYVDEEPVKCNLTGVIRGMLRDGIKVKKGMKSGDVDPRGELSYCYTPSDKALAVAGGVLEAILHFSGVNNE